MNPYVIRSKGVAKCLRFASGSADGPSFGNFASEADLEIPQTFVTPSSRRVNPYAAATLIGPETLFTEIPSPPEPLLTWSTAKLWTSGFSLFPVAGVRPPVHALLHGRGEREVITYSRVALPLYLVRRLQD